MADIYCIFICMSEPKPRIILRLISACSNALHFLHQALIILLRQTQRWPKISLLLGAIILAIGVSSVSKLNFILSADDMNESQFASSNRFQQLRKSYADKNSSWMIIKPPEGRTDFTEAELCRIRYFYDTAKISIPEITQSSSNFDLVKSYFDPSNTAVGLKRILDLNCRDPKNVPVSWAEIRNSPWSSLFSSRTIDDISIQFIFSDAEHYKYGSFNPAPLNQLRARVQSDLLPAVPGLKISWAGSADYMQEVINGIEASSSVNAFFCLFLILIMRLFFGKWRCGLFFVFTLVASTIVLYGLMAFFGTPKDALSDSLFLMIGVASLEDYVFISYLQLRLGRSALRCLRKIVLPCFLTSLTTTLGFASLMVSDLESVRRLGLWASVGSMLEFFMLFVILPSVIKLVNPKMRWVDSVKSRGIDWIAKISLHKPSRLFARSLLLVFPLAVVSLAYLNINDSPLNLFPPSNPIRKAYDEILHDRGWQSQVSVVFDEAPSLQDGTKIATELAKLPHVTQVESAENDWNFLAQGVPQLWQPPLRNVFISSKYYERFVDGVGRQRYILGVDTTYSKEIEKTEFALDDYCRSRGCWAAGSLLKHAELSRKLPETLLESMVVSLTLVSAVLLFITFATGQPHLIFPVLASSMWGPACILVMISVLQIPVNFLTCILASVLVGITGDNAVQFLLFSKKNSLMSGIEKVGGAATVCLGTMAFACLFFLLSNFAPPRVFGVLMGIGLLASLFGDVWILGGLLHKPSKSHSD